MNTTDEHDNVIFNICTNKENTIDLNKPTVFI